MILAGDIGATKTNMAYFTEEHGTLVPAVIKSYHSHQFRSLQEVIHALRLEHPASITSAAFGIAGPIVDNRSKLTNLGWDVDGREIAKDLGLSAVGLMNDLEATAYGTLRLKDEDLVTLQAGIAQQGGAIAVIAAGTGLGEGGLVWDGRRYRAIPSEGGHTDFGPRNELEMDLLRFLCGKYERVSYERAVSGPGLFNVYEFFRSRADYPEPPWLKAAITGGDPSAAVSQAAMAGKDSTAEDALALFVSLYGAEAGNLALKLLATGGVFVGGGIAPKILPWIRKAGFMDSFLSKGRYRPLLEHVPVKVVLNDKTALLGAAHYALLMTVQ
jgi:glucokinase